MLSYALHIQILLKLLYAHKCKQIKANYQTLLILSSNVKADQSRILHAAQNFWDRTVLKCTHVCMCKKHVICMLKHANDFYVSFQAFF